MKVKAMISIIPIGVGVSLSKYVAACEKVLRGANLNAQLHAHGTNVEGNWNEVMGAVKACLDAVHGMGAPRISTYLKLSSRIDREQSMEDMVRSVESKL